MTTADAIFLGILVLLPLALMIAGYALRRGSMAMAAMGAWFILCVYAYMQTGSIYNAIFWLSIGLTIASGIEAGTMLSRGEEEAEEHARYDASLDEAYKAMELRVETLRARRVNRPRLPITQIDIAPRGK